MQDSTITLALDADNNGSTVDTVISRIDETANRSRYKFPAHTLISRDYVDLYRTYNKKSGNFNGVAKCAIKCTKDVEVPGVDTTTSVVSPIIGEVSFSLPVGSTPADQLEIGMRLVAMVKHALFTKLRELEI